LRESGLLWLLNRAVLHPRGFALALHYDNGIDEEPTGWSLEFAGVGEPWAFDHGIEPELFQKVEALLKRTAIYGSSPIKHPRQEGRSDEEGFG
jgi:hypothetical protein